MGKFRATCARKHPEIHFLDGDEFVKHMRTEHKVRGYVRTQMHIATPRPWVAPKAPVLTHGLTKVLLDNSDDVEDISTDSQIAPALLAVGDIFALGPGRLSYEVLEIEPEGRGFHLRMFEGKEAKKDGWLKELTVPKDRYGSVRTPVDTVSVIGRAKPVKKNTADALAELAA